MLGYGTGDYPAEPGGVQKGHWTRAEVARCLKHVLCDFKSTLCHRCKAVRPGQSVRSKKGLTESWIDLTTILRCFLSFKTVVTSRNILVFKIKFSRPKNDHPSHPRKFGPRATAWGGASEPGGAKCGRSPNQGPPDLSMGRVSAAGPSPGPWLPFRNCVEKGSM